MMPRETCHAKVAKAVPPRAAMRSTTRRRQAAAILSSKTASAWLGEPTLDELLSEPIITALMQSDGVDRHELESMLQRLAIWRHASSGPRLCPRRRTPVTRDEEEKCCPNQL
jgi:hypothetical protein